MPFFLIDATGRHKRNTPDRNTVTVDIGDRRKTLRRKATRSGGGTENDPSSRSLNFRTRKMVYWRYRRESKVSTLIECADKPSEQFTDQLTVGRVTLRAMWKFGKRDENISLVINDNC